MADWERVERDLDDTGDTGFEFDSGETTGPGLSGEWLVGKVEREGRLKRENLPFPLRLFDAIPFGGAVSTDPEFTPEGVRQVAEAHGLDVVIVSVGSDWVRIAVVDPD